MNDDQRTRREILRGAGAALLLPVLPAFVVGCKKDLACTDTTGLAPEKVALRTTMEYVDATPNPTKTCANCQLFKPAAPDACGECSLVPGPIHPKGYCKSWTEKAG